MEDEMMGFLGDLFGDDDEGGSFGSYSSSTSYHHGPSPPEPRAECGYVGLLNQGATCYMNSLLQAIFMTPELRTALYQLTPKDLRINWRKYEKELEEEFASSSEKSEKNTEAKDKKEETSTVSRDEKTETTEKMDTSTTTDQNPKSSVEAKPLPNPPCPDENEKSKGSNIPLDEEVLATLRAMELPERQIALAARMSPHANAETIINLIFSGACQEQAVKPNSSHVETLNPFGGDDDGDDQMSMVRSSKRRRVPNAGSVSHQAASQPSRGRQGLGKGKRTRDGDEDGCVLFDDEEDAELAAAMANSLADQEALNKKTVSEKEKEKAGETGDAATKTPEAANKDPDQMEKESGNTASAVEKKTTEASAGGAEAKTAGVRRKRRGRIIPYELRRLFGFLQAVNECAVGTQRLTRSFGWQGNQGFQQQDVHELNRVLFDALELSLRRTPAENLFKDLYQGMQVNTLTCLQCGRISSREESFMDVPLVVANQPTLMTSLSSVVSLERLCGANQYHCERCEGKVDALRGTSFRKLPPILILCLLRFQFGLYEGAKDGSDFPFPMLLDMRPYTEESCRKAQLAEVERVKKEDKEKEKKLAVAAQEKENSSQTQEGKNKESQGALKEEGAAKGDSSTAISASEEIKPKEKDDEEEDASSIHSLVESGEGDEVKKETQGKEKALDSAVNGGETPQTGREEEKKKEVQDEQPKLFQPKVDLTSPHLYELSSVVIHVGSTASSGHYFAYIREPFKYIPPIKTPAAAESVDSSSKDDNQERKSTVEEQKKANLEESKPSSAVVAPPSEKKGDGASKAEKGKEGSQDGKGKEEEKVDSVLTLAEDSGCKERWLEFDDRRVREIDPQKIASQYGGRSQCAYMVSYRKYTPGQERPEVPVLPRDLQEMLDEHNARVEKQREEYAKELNRIHLQVCTPNHVWVDAHGTARTVDCKAESENNQENQGENHQAVAEKDKEASEAAAEHAMPTQFEVVGEKDEPVSKLLERIVAALPAAGPGVPSEASQWELAVLSASKGPLHIRKRLSDPNLLLEKTDLSNGSALLVWDGKHVGVKGEQNWSGEGPARVLEVLQYAPLVTKSTDEAETSAKKDDTASPSDDSTLDNEADQEKEGSKEADTEKEKEKASVFAALAKPAGPLKKHTLHVRNTTTVTELATLISEACDLPVSQLFVCQLDDGSLRPLWEAGDDLDDTSLCDLGFADDSDRPLPQLTVEPLTEEIVKGSLKKSAAQADWKHRATQLEVYVTDGLSGRDPQPMLTISCSQELTIAELKYEQDQPNIPESTHVHLRRRGLTGLAGEVFANELYSLKQYLVRDGDRLLVERGDPRATRGTILLSCILAVDEAKLEDDQAKDGKYLKAEAYVHKTTTVLECKQAFMAMIPNGDKLNEKEYCIRKTNYWGEPCRYFDSEQSTLQMQKIYGGELLYLEKGVQPVKGNIDVTVQLYLPSLHLYYPHLVTSLFPELNQAKNGEEPKCDAEKENITQADSASQATATEEKPEVSDSSDPSLLEKKASELAMVGWPPQGPGVSGWRTAYSPLLQHMVHTRLIHCVDEAVSTLVNLQHLFETTVSYHTKLEEFREIVLRSHPKFEVFRNTPIRLWCGQKLLKKHQVSLKKNNCQVDSTIIVEVLPPPPPFEDKKEEETPKTAENRESQKSKDQQNLKLSLSVHPQEDECLMFIHRRNPKTKLFEDMREVVVPRDVSDLRPFIASLYGVKAEEISTVAKLWPFNLRWRRLYPVSLENSGQSQGRRRNRTRPRKVNKFNQFRAERKRQLESDKNDGKEKDGGMGAFFVSLDQDSPPQSRKRTAEPSSEPVHKKKSDAKDESKPKTFATAQTEKGNPSKKANFQVEARPSQNKAPPSKNEKEGGKMTESKMKSKALSAPRAVKNHAMIMPRDGDVIAFKLLADDPEGKDEFSEEGTRSGGGGAGGRGKRRRAGGGDWMYGGTSSVSGGGGRNRRAVQQGIKIDVDFYDSEEEDEEDDEEESHV